METSINRDAVTIKSGYVPGMIGRVTELHGAYYAAHWNLGLYFEAKVASELAAFMMGFDQARDGAWIAEMNGEIVGGIFIAGQDANVEAVGARLRWFILDERYQGYGIGNRLVSEAVSFCRQKRYQRVYLTTFSGLNAARHLYEKYGFRLCGEEDASELTGSSTLVEQIFEWFPAMTTQAE